MKKASPIYRTRNFKSPSNNSKIKEPIKLRKEFIGRGEVSGFKFSLIWVTKWGFLYKVTHSGTSYYEVFKKRINRRFATYSYPSSKSFGIWAWTYKSISQAFEKLKSFDPHLANQSLNTRKKGVSYVY